MAAIQRRITPVAAVEFAVVTLIWGSTWLVIKGQLGVVPAAWSVTYRFVLAGGIMLAICLVRRIWVRPTPTAHAFALAAGGAQFMLNFNFVYAAEMYLASGLVALIFALLIVSNTLLARVFLGAAVTPRFAAGAAVGLAGLALVFAPDLVRAGARPGSAASTATGVVLALGGVIGASMANVMQATRLARSLPALPTLALTMLYGAALDALYALATAGPPVFDPRPEYALGLCYLAGIASVLAFSLYYGMIRRIGPGAAAYTSVVIPVVAMALSTAFEGYAWTPPAAAGGCLALVGLVIALSGRRPA